MRLRGYTCGALLLTMTLAGCAGDPETEKQKRLARGDAYAKTGKYVEAALEYRGALQIDPQFGMARYRLATAYIELNDPRRALEESVRAADLLPADADVQLQAANLLIITGQYGDARDRASKALQSNPKDVRAQLALGNAMAGLQDLDGAIAQVEEALRIDPTRVGSYANLASLHAAAGRVDDAERIFKDAVAKHPDSVTALLTLAHFYWVLERPALAEPIVQRALAISPAGDVAANRFAATYYQSIGQLDKAEQYLKVAVAREGTPQARLMLADYYLGVGRSADAAPVLTALTQDAAVGSAARTRLAAIDYSAGRIDAAIAALDALLEEEPRNVQALLVRASTLFDAAKYDEALARADAAIAVEPWSAAAHFARGRILRAKLEPEQAKAAFNEVLRLNPRAAGAQVELAQLHLEAGATDTSISLAGTALKTEPTRSDARLVLARGLLARRDFIQARGLLHELRNAFPDSAVVHAQLGLAQALQNQRADAVASFERALEIDPLQLDAIGGMVTLDLTEGRQAEAKRRIGEAVQAAPRYAGVLTLAGRVYIMTKALMEAEDALERAIEADPANLAAYSLLGDVYLQQNRLEDARREFEILAERQSRPISSLTMVGLIFDMQGKTAEATKVFERVVQLDARAAVAANNLAWIYAEHGGNLDIALQLAQTAKAALPDEPTANDTLGWVLLKKQLVPLAIVSLKHAVDLAPTNATYQFHLGMAYAQSGDIQRAKAAVQTALQLDPKFKSAAEATRLLATL